MPKLILLNGPARSGKDFAAKELLKVLHEDDAVHLKFSTPLKEVASIILGESCDKLESKKDIQLPFGASYRDVQITLFDSISQAFTKAWLGRSLVQRIRQSDASTIIVSDCGRDEELLPLIQAFGAKNILVVQIFKDGCDFNYDIRYYLTSPQCRRVSLHNDGTENFKLKITDIVLDFLA